MAGNLFTKNPASILDYKFDWRARTNQDSSDPDVTDWLEAGETITSYYVSASFVPGSSGSSGSLIRIVDDYMSNSNSSVVVWLGGGDLNAQYLVACRVITSSSPVARQDERNIKVMIQDV